MSQILQAIRGMNDILPEEAELWEQFEEAVRDWLRSYGYRPIRMPVVEPTPLFARAIGAVTDIVEKEMYSFTDSLNGELLTLRPEGTAGCVRAALQHNLLYDGPKRLWYQGPMFRHERPQKGRYRQFHQIGVEALGYSGPDIDAEMIQMCQRFWDDLGLKNVHLELNSLGQTEERQAHRAALIEYFSSHAALLDADAQRRLHSNPLRILDSKNPAMQDLIEKAPRLLDHLGPDSLRHFESVQVLLKDSGIPYRINPRLVRGLDYYNLTVFEWVTDSLGAQGTVCAGGRYDGLFAQLGGKSQPACGFAMGIERLLMLWQGAGGKAPPQAVDIYVVHQGEQAQRFAFRVAEGLRDNGYSVQLHCGGGNFKAQMKRADNSGAMLAAIIGEDEAAASEVTLKPLRESIEQRRVAYDQLAEAIGELLYEWDDENGGI
ncbi:MAG: histidine--tRNA ligase [Betaproteobacteria bacterium]|nr:histidine--tRNA ligase [Betaproteobacteria bacterium]